MAKVIYQDMVGTRCRSEQLHCDIRLLRVSVKTAVRLEREQVLCTSYTDIVPWSDTGLVIITTITVIIIIRVGAVCAEKGYDVSFVLAQRIL